VGGEPEGPDLLPRGLVQVQGSAGRGLQGAVRAWPLDGAGATGLRHSADRYQQKDIIDGDVYAVCLADEFYIKAVHRKPGMVVLRSYNKDFEDIEVVGEQMNELCIIGKMVWRGGNNFRLIFISCIDWFSMDESKIPLSMKEIDDFWFLLMGRSAHCDGHHWGLHIDTSKDPLSTA
jgi:hypothetical protein